MRRLMTVTTLGAVVSAGGLGLTTVPASSPQPVTPKVRQLAMTTPPASADASRMTVQGAVEAHDEGELSGSVAVLAVAPDVTADARPLVVGARWDPRQSARVSIQYRTRDALASTWSTWETAHHDHDHGPDRATGEPAGPPSTDPLVVGTGSVVQVRAVGRPGARMVRPELVVVDPGQSAADATVGTGQPGAAAAAASRPTIYTRAQWGANESLRKGEPSYAGVQAAAIHHTVSTNSYSSSQVPGIIRGIYAYHVNGNGWNDIGYNFLIDRFGRIWEGRYGGVTRAVIGAHSAGSNSWTTGIATIGTFSSASVPSAVVTANRRLVGWKGQVHQFDPGRPANVGGRLVRGVSGHRNLYSTECPGAYLYNAIPTIASGASALVQGLPSLTVNRDVDNYGDNDVVVTNAGADLMLFHSDGSGRMVGPTYVSRGAWTGIDLVATVGDWTGDAAVDLIARVPSTGRLRLYAGNGRGSFRSGVDIGVGWNGMTAIVGVGDFSGDRRADLVARGSDGLLRLYRGDGRGGFGSASVIGSGWQGMAHIVGVGDWDRNGTTDILGVTTSGRAYLYRGSGTGRISGSFGVAGSWSGLRSVTALGDATSDTRVDVLAVGTDGVARVVASGPDPSTTGAVTQSGSWAAVSVYGG